MADNIRIPSTKRGTAHKSMLNILSKNLESPVPGQLLFEASGKQVNYQRRIRELRADGWNIEYKSGGEDGKGWYTLNPPFPSGERNDRTSTAVRMNVLRRDNWTCQLCGGNRGKNPSIVLNVDHRVPFELSKDNSIENLQTLCEDCNLGKKAQCRDCAKKRCKECELAFPELRG